MPKGSDSKRQRIHEPVDAQCKIWRLDRLVSVNEMIKIYEKELLNTIEDFIRKSHRLPKKKASISNSSFSSGGSCSKVRGLIRTSGETHKVWVLRSKKLVVKVMKESIIYFSKLRVLEDIRHDLKKSFSLHPEVDESAVLSSFSDKYGSFYLAYIKMEALLLMYKIELDGLAWASVTGDQLFKKIDDTICSVSCDIGYNAMLSERCARLVRQEWDARDGKSLISKVERIHLFDDIPKFTLIVQSWLDNSTVSDAKTDAYLCDRLGKDSRLLLDCHNVASDGKGVVRGVDPDFDVYVGDDGYDSDRSENIRSDMCKENSEYLDRWVTTYFRSKAKSLPLSIARIRLVLALMKRSSSLKKQSEIGQPSCLPKALLTKVSLMSSTAVSACLSLQDSKKNPEEVDAYFSLSEAGEGLFAENTRSVTPSP